VNPRLPDAVVEFGEAAEKALQAAGGVDLARAAEADPAERRRAGAALEALGATELDPFEDLDSAAAAGELCRAAGRVALPYPVVPVVVGRGRNPLALGGRDASYIDHGDVFPAWTMAEVASTPSGDQRWGAVVGGDRLATKLGPFLTPVVASGPGGSAERSDVDLHLVLTAWLVLGATERALELAVDHVSGRVQFGQTLASFQAVQFQLADVAVAVDGLREMCRFSLWRWWDAPESCRPDSLAARLCALDAARAVMRTCQQLHGAAGVCDEYDVSVIYRHIQPLLRLPFGAERTAEVMADAIAALGFDGLFPHGGPGAVWGRP